MIDYLRHFVVLFVAVSLMVSSVAQDGNRKKPSSKKSTTPSTSKSIPVKLSVDQENVALKFAKKHHPELAKLLEQLHKSSPAGFNRGIREIYIAVQRLERYREKQPARFEADLLSWKIDSKVRLLTARWAMSQDPELEKEIRALLRTRQQAKIDRLKVERERVAERLKQLDDQIGMGTADLEADLVAEWDRLSKRASVSAKNRRTQSKKNDSNDKSEAKSKTKAAKTD